MRRLVLCFLTLILIPTTLVGCVQSGVGSKYDRYSLTFLGSATETGVVVIAQSEKVRVEVNPGDSALTVATEIKKQLEDAGVQVQCLVEKPEQDEVELILSERIQVSIEGTVLGITVGVEGHPHEDEGIRGAITALVSGYEAGDQAKVAMVTSASFSGQDMNLLSKIGKISRTEDPLINCEDAVVTVIATARDGKEHRLKFELSLSGMLAPRWLIDGITAPDG